MLLWASYHLVLSAPFNCYLPTCDHSLNSLVSVFIHLLEAGEHQYELGDIMVAALLMSKDLTFTYIFSLHFIHELRHHTLDLSSLHILNSEVLSSSEVLPSLTAPNHPSRFLTPLTELCSPSSFLSLYLRAPPHPDPHAPHLSQSNHVDHNPRYPHPLSFCHNYSASIQLGSSRSLVILALHPGGWSTYWRKSYNHGITAKLKEPSQTPARPSGTSGNLCISAESVHYPFPKMP